MCSYCRRRSNSARYFFHPTSYMSHLWVLSPYIILDVLTNVQLLQTLLDLRELLLSPYMLHITFGDFSTYFILDVLTVMPATRYCRRRSNFAGFDRRLLWLDIYIYTYIYIYIFIYIYIYICIYICVCVCVCVCVCIDRKIDRYIDRCIYILTYVYICIHI